jgi:hypothetical protein
MWVLIFMLLGILGSAYLSATLYFYRELSESGAMEWMGPGTAVARLSVLCFLLGIVGVFGFVVQALSGKREHLAYKVVAFLGYLGLFVLACVLGIPV